MEEKSILVVEDERAIREMVVFTLKRAGFSVREAEDANAARHAVADRRPDLVLLDWMLPDLSGLELARSLRREDATRELPIMMLTARAAEDDKVLGLESGADDYLTKPFSSRELVARIQALLRRASGAEGEALAVGKLKLDPASHRVSADGTEVTLGPTEYRLLKFFMSQPERVFSRAQVLDRVWGGNVYIEERTVDVHIRRLRKALTPHGCESYIQTVRGSGYRFSAQGTVQ
ncbi:MAG TPA: phosphate regulon transcriptional regulator PhoB [Gammaproteobacteria bacterium]|nr:phosphate regulon transcriptional regulator PhoB [Gammaproteobacteria bacterium]